VLNQLNEGKAISDAEFSAAADALDPMIADMAAAKKPAAPAEIGPYFIDFVRRDIQRRANVDLRERRLRVELTMDPDAQEAVEASVQEGLARFEISRRRAVFSGPERNIAAEIAAATSAAPTMPVAAAPLAPLVAAASLPPSREAGSLSPSSRAPLAAPGARVAAKPGPATRFGAAAGSAPGAATAVAGSPAAAAAEVVPAWLAELRRARLPFADVHWPRALVLEVSPPGRNRNYQWLPGRATVGLVDGRKLSLSSWDPSVFSSLKTYDIIYVQATGNGAELRARPQLQASAIVMESATGRVLGLSGGFSFPMSQINRATDTRRPPGSTVKPLTYLAALASGLQPNTMVLDAPVTLPPVDGNGPAWTPNNDQPSAEDSYKPLRAGLEGSINRMTANLLSMIAPDPARSLDLALTEMRQCGLYAHIGRFYPNILGASDVSLIDLAACYAALSNGGWVPVPHFYEKVEIESWQGDRLRRDLLLDGEQWKPRKMRSADDLAFFQLRTLLQGVVARGTAWELSKTLADLVPRHAVSEYIGGKTGTSQFANDAWFMGFTKDLVIGVWVGYDNGSRARNLGAGATGAGVAAPIFANIVRAIAKKRPLQPLPGPSPAVQAISTRTQWSDGISDYLRNSGAFARPPAPQTEGLY
jgi:membrane carboxypeptidase/penicillin-binding protein